MTSPQDYHSELSGRVISFNGYPYFMRGTICNYSIYYQAIECFMTILSQITGTRGL